MLTIDNVFNNFKFSKIDNNNSKRYNKYVVLNKGSQTDFCSFKGVKKVVNKDEAEQILKNLKKYENLEQSPVAYIQPLVEEYLNGKLLGVEFAQNFINKTNIAKYALSQMPEEDIKNNQKLFVAEFELADKLYQQLSKNPSGNNILQSLQNIILTKEN